MNRFEADALNPIAADVNVGVAVLLFDLNMFNDVREKFGRLFESG